MDIHISGCLLLQNNSGQQKSAEFYLLCSALLCSALLCSALLCCQYMAPVSSLSTPFYKLFQDFRKSKTAALQAQSCDTNTGNQSAVSRRQIAAG